MSAAELSPPLERILRVLPAVLYATFTWFVSSQTADSLPSAVPDKLAHFGEYGLLTLLLVFAMTAFETERVTARALALSAAISVAWGMLDEVHQAFVPSRESSSLDLVADGAGTAAALALVALLAWRERRRP